MSEEGLKALLEITQVVKIIKKWGLIKQDGDQEDSEDGTEK